MQSKFKQQIRAIQRVRSHGTLKLTKKASAVLNDAGSTIAGWVFLQTSLKARIAEIRADDRLHIGAYPVTPDIDAELALTQTALATELATLEQIVGVTRTRLPIRPKKS